MGNRPIKTMGEIAAESPEAAAAIRRMNEQMLIVFVKRAGGTVVVPVAEVDDTGNDTLIMEVVGRDFVFKAGKKQ